MIAVDTSANVAVARRELYWADYAVFLMEHDCLVGAGTLLEAHLVLSRTTFGRHVYLIGSNEQAAVLSGIAVRRTKILIFMIAAFLASCAAVVWAVASVQLSATTSSSPRSAPW